MTSDAVTEQFIQSITEHQNRLSAYIFSLLGDHARTADVLQETNLVLWRKKDEYQVGKAFLPWAFTIAKFQVLAHLRDRSREGELLDITLVDTVAEHSRRLAENVEDRQVALQQCMQELSPNHRKLIEQKYVHAKSIQDLSLANERGESAVKVALLRIRKKLHECVRLKLALARID